MIKVDPVNLQILKYIQNIGVFQAGTESNCVLHNLNDPEDDPLLASNEDGVSKKYMGLQAMQQGTGLGMSRTELEINCVGRNQCV